MVSVDVKHHVYLKKRLKSHGPEHVYNTLGYNIDIHNTVVGVGVGGGLVGGGIG